MAALVLRTGGEGLVSECTHTLKWRDVGVSRVFRKEVKDLR
jgi:hypothetical protein